jgi:hypothetical protein
MTEIDPDWCCSQAYRGCIGHPADSVLTGSVFYRSVEISSQTRAGFYDCLYVALAEQENCQLVTADDKLINALQARFPFIVSLASLP